MADYLRRAEGSGLSWPVPEAIDDVGLERRLFPALPPSSPSRPLPEWSEVHRELGRKGVTLSLLWQEYKALHPEGLQYSWFCEQYRAWAADLLSSSRTATPCALRSSPASFPSTSGMTP